MEFKIGEVPQLQNPEIQLFVSKQEVNAINKKQGYELIIKQGLIQTVFLYQNYKGPLPFGIARDITLFESVGLFGQPAKKGGGFLQIQAQFSNLGLCMIFKSKQWIKQAKLNYLYYFKTGSATVCGTCESIKSMSACDCNRLFCCKECLSQLSKIHAVLCKKYKY